MHRYFVFSTLAVAVIAGAMTLSTAPAAAACISNGARYSHGSTLCFAKSLYQYRCLPPAAIGRPDGRRSSGCR